MNLIAVTDALKQTLSTFKLALNNEIFAYSNEMLRLV